MQSLKQELEFLLDINAENIKVIKFEYGVVIDVTDKDILFRNFGMYKKIRPEMMSSKGRIYGVQYTNSTHRVKLYDKSYEAKRNGIHLNRDYLRIEKCVSTWALRSNKSFKQVKLNNFEDLCSIQIQNLLFQDLYETIDKIEFTDLKKIGNFSIRELRVYSYMNDETIRKIVSKNFKTAYSNDSKVYNACIEKLKTNKKKNFLKSVYQIKENLNFGTRYLEQKKGTTNKNSNTKNI